VSTGKKLGELLELRGRNANDLAVAIKEKPQTIYSIIKRDSTRIDIQLLFRIAKELDVAVDYFTDRKVQERIKEEAENYNENYQKFLRAMEDKPGLQKVICGIDDITPDDIDKVLRIIKAIKE